MPVAVLQIEIILPESHSLKDRRQIVRSLKDRLRQQFNVSVAELAGDGDADTRELWQRATLGVAAISADGAYLLAQLNQAAAAAERILAGMEVRCGTVEIVA